MRSKERSASQTRIGVDARRNLQHGKSRAEARSLQSLVAGAFAQVGFALGVRARFARECGADFANGGVAGALAGAPHVPTGDGAIGAPALAEGEEFLGF